MTDLPRDPDRWTITPLTFGRSRLHYFSEWDEAAGRLSVSGGW